MSKPKTDVRILTLKRLHQPLRVGLLPMLEHEAETPGEDRAEVRDRREAHQYYCFQSRQIVSLDQVDSPDGKHALEKQDRSRPAKR